MTDDTPVGLNRTERVLAAMIAGVAGISVLSLAAVLIARAAGVEDFSAGAWALIAPLPGVGLPVTFLLILAFVIVAIVRRRRLAAGGER